MSDNYRPIYPTALIKWSLISAHVNFATLICANFESILHSGLAKIHQQIPKCAKKKHLFIRLRPVVKSLDSLPRFAPPLVFRN